MAKKTIKLGQEVQDIVSGFKGTVYGKSDFLYGCTRIAIQPKVKEDGTFQGAQWFDEPQVEVISKKKEKTGGRDKGGPIPSIPTCNI
jgi:hypothetical protein